MTTATMLVVVAIIAFLATDPLKLSPFSKLDFTPVAIDRGQPPSPLTDPRSRLKNAQRLHHKAIAGPESIAFDSEGNFYSGVHDGRVLKLSGDTITEYVPSNAAGCQRPFPESVPHEHECGRKLGLRFDPNGSGDLYMADAYLGLMKVGPGGGKPEVLTSEAEGVPFRFTNDLAITKDGNIYFTDSSTKYQRRQFFVEVMEAGTYGRLLKYDPSTKETTVLMRNLAFANGITLALDESFLLINELNMCRIIKYWLAGSKAGTSEVLVTLPGLPDNIRTAPDGNFWVALSTKRTAFFEQSGSLPWLRVALGKLPVNFPVLFRMLSGKPKARVVKLSGEGKVLEVLEDSSGDVVGMVSEVEEHDNKLYLGNVIHDYVAVYDLTQSGESAI